MAPEKRISVKPYKDSPLWFCAANRVNWDYEYFWLPGHAWTMKKSKGLKKDVSDFSLGCHYPYPIVPALNLEIDLDALPVCHSWGDTDCTERPHIWGSPGTDSDRRPEFGKGKGKSKQRKGKSQVLRDAAYERGYEKQRVDKKHRVSAEFYGAQALGA